MQEKTQPAMAVSFHSLGAQLGNFPGDQILVNGSNRHGFHNGNVIGECCGNRCTDELTIPVEKEFCQIVLRFQRSQAEGILEVQMHSGAGGIFFDGRNRHGIFVPLYAGKPGCAEFGFRFCGLSVIGYRFKG